MVHFVAAAVAVAVVVVVAVNNAASLQNSSFFIATKLLQLQRHRIYLVATEFLNAILEWDSFQLPSLLHFSRIFSVR